jgi:hypothetical protein
MEQQSITKQISKPNVVSRYYSDGSYEKNCRDDIDYDGSANQCTCACLIANFVGMTLLNV